MALAIGLRVLFPSVIPESGYFCISKQRSGEEMESIGHS